MNIIKSLLVIVTALMAVPLNIATAADVSLDPGYLVGQATMGNADATFTTTSISTNASGGGYTAAKTTPNSSNYQLTVQGGDWNYNVGASAVFNSTNSSPNTANSSISVIYNNRSIQVSPGESVTNDYVNSGVIKFQLNITGDATTRFATGYWYAQKATTTNERTYTRFRPSNSNATTHRNAYWYVPVAPNQGITVTGSLVLYCSTGSRQYTFNETVNVNPGQTVEVPLNITFTCPPPPPPGGGGGGTCTYYPLSIDGMVGLPGVATGDFNYTTVFINHTLNPSPYAYTYSNLCNYTTYTVTPRPVTYLKGNSEGTYTWPWLGGNQANNTVTLSKDYVTHKDYIGEAVPISGEIRYTGTVQNADLNQYTVNFTGEHRVYKSGAWINNLPANGGSLAFTRHKSTSGLKRPSQLSYLNYLSPGDWYTGQWTAQKIVTTPYTRTSNLNFTDYNNHYDGTATYDFGTPIRIESGVPKQKDFEYCMGSAIFRFRDTTGRLLSNPYVAGTGNHRNSSNKIDLTISSVTGQATVTNNAAPEVEIFGPTANYTLSTVRVVAQDGSTITFPPINVSLACNTTKIFDIPGPTLNVSSPSGELVTNSLSTTVAGRAFSGSTIETVTVNGVAAPLTPIAGGNNNEVSFARDLALVDGKNTITIIATDVSGAQAQDQIIVSVDRWLPTTSITNGDRFPNTETSVPFTVSAADRGYGYTLEVYLDGALVSTKEGAGNDTTPVSISYAGALTDISLGTHTITAIATDLAGNSVTRTSTIEIYEARDNYPPTITRLGDATVVVEAGTTYSDAGATATDDRDGNITDRIIVSNPVNPLLVGTYTVTYNVTDTAANAAQEVTRTVMVIDTIPPVLAIPSDITVEATGTVTPVFFGEATATDLFSVTISNDAPGLFHVGTTIVTWTAMDANGNDTTGEQEITVQDTTAPTVIPPAGMTVEATAAFSTIDTGNATANDAVGVVSLTSDAPATFPLGVTTITWTAKDAAGNIGTATQTITVKDTAAPVLDGLLNQSIEAVSTSGATASFTVTATDNIDTAPVVICSAASASIFALGETIITCTATDASGNSAGGSFTVNVKDTTNPLLAIPADITVEAAAPETVVEIGQATATDIFDVTIANNGLAAYPVATTEVLWTATDANGNGASAIQRITVQDTIAPVVTPPANIAIEATGSLTPVTVGTATSTDAVGVVSLTSDAPATFPLGTTTVIWTARDAAGNVGTATQTVTVIDTTAPVLDGLADQVLEATSAAGAAGSFTVTAIDLGQQIPVTCSATSGSTFALGESTVTCTATDASGNSVSGSFTVKVQDTTPPVLVVPETITVYLNTAVSASTVQSFLNGASANDIVDSSVTITSTTPILTSVGSKTVTFTAVDDFGNTTTKTAVIKVIYGCGDTYLNNEETNFSTPVTLLKPFKLGSTIPVKLRLCDANGADVLTATPRLYVQMFSGEEPVGEPIEVTSTSAADTGNYFRVLGNMYMYNLATKPLASGIYQLQAVLDDGTTRVIPLALKQ